MWIWGNFMKNRYFANTSLIKVWIWEFFCTHVTLKTVIIFRTANFASTKSILDKYWFTFPILRFLAHNRQTLFKDWCLKQMLSKRANTRHLFFKKYMLKYFFYSDWNFRVFKIMKFWTVQCGLWQNATSCDPLIKPM